MTPADTAIWVLLSGLAAARLFQLFARDTILAQPREWVYDRYPRIADFVACPWCAGFWFAAGVFTLVWFVRSEIVVFLVAVAAISEIVGLLKQKGE